MYHPLNRITCPPLDKLNELARLTLEFCLTQTFDLSEDQIRERFVQHFSDNDYLNAGEWLWGKTALVRPHILKLISLPVVEKEDIYTVYLHNHELTDRFAAGDFEPVPLPPVSVVAYDTAAELAGNFYKILCDGVPHEKINETDDLDRQTVLRAYRDAQRQISLKVCPGCDGTPPSILDGVIHEDIDHFFPKSKYPFLSIHPLNLTPYCKNCNQTYKKNKDAILDTDPVVADVHGLVDIYHPYEKPAKSELSLVITNNPIGNREFCFDSNSNLACLHSLQYTLDIEGRWTGDLIEERTEEALFGLLLFGSQDDRKNNFQPDQAWLNQQLGTAIQTFRRQIGRQPNCVPALAYTQWVVANPQEQARLLGLVQASLSVPVYP